MSEDLAPEIENNGDNEDVSHETESSTVETNESPEASNQQETDADEKKRAGVQKRIDQLTREKYEERRRAEELEARLKDLESKISKPEPVAAPNPEDFDDYNEYLNKQADYLASLAQERIRRSQEQELKAAEQRRLADEQAERAQRYKDRVEAELSQYEGFMERVNDPTFNRITNVMHPDIIALIQESDKGTALTYHLATHLSEADRIAKLSPVLAARELAILETKIQSPKPKKVSEAPDPIKPLGGNEQAVKNEDQMSIDEWMAWRNRQIRGN